MGRRSTARTSRLCRQSDRMYGFRADSSKCCEREGDQGVNTPHPVITVFQGELSKNPVFSQKKIETRNVKSDESVNSKES